MKSQIILIAVLVGFLLKPDSCLSQTELITITIPECCPKEDRNEFLRSLYPIEENPASALLFGFSELVGYLAILVEPTGFKDENYIGQDIISRTNIKAIIGDRMEFQETLATEYIQNYDNNIASSYEFITSMAFKMDTDHVFKLKVEGIQIESCLMMKSYITKNNEYIFYSQSINDVVSSAKIHNKAEVNQLYDLLKNYLENLGCLVQIYDREGSISSQAENNSYICLCVRIADLSNNVRFID